MTVVYFLAVLSVIVFVHEFGHYITAKMFGAGVKEFAIGFGPKLISKKYGETVYSIRIIPLGGFCDIVGMEPDEKGLDDMSKAFISKTAFQRFIILFAGAFMNFVLAIATFIVMYSFFGYQSMVTVVGKVFKDRPAYVAGLKTGDKIVKINGKNVENDADIRRAIMTAKDHTDINMVVERTNKSIDVKLRPEIINGRKMIGISFDNPPVIGMVDNSDPAYKAGLRDKDRIVKINGKNILTFSQILKRLSANGNNTVEMSILRESKAIDLKFKVKQFGSMKIGKIEYDYEFDKDEFMFTPMIESISGNLKKLMKTDKALIHAVNIEGKRQVVSSPEELDFYIERSESEKPINIVYSDYSDQLKIEYTKEKLEKSIDKGSFPIFSINKDDSKVKKGQYRILSLNSKEFVDYEKYKKYISEIKDDNLKLKIVYVKNVDYKPVLVPRGIFNFAPLMKIDKLSIKDSVYLGFYDTYKWLAQMLAGFKLLITGKLGSDAVSGPIGIAKVIKNQAKYGLYWLLRIMAILSINIGLLNLFPIPALDGGRIIFIFLEVIRGGKKVTAKTEEIIHTVGFVFLLALMVFATYKDIIRLIFG